MLASVAPARPRGSAERPRAGSDEPTFSSGAQFELTRQLRYLQGLGGAVEREQNQPGGQLNRDGAARRRTALGHLKEAAEAYWSFQEATFLSPTPQGYSGPPGADLRLAYETALAGYITARLASRVPLASANGRDRRATTPNNGVGDSLVNYRAALRASAATPGLAANVVLGGRIVDELDDLDAALSGPLHEEAAAVLAPLRAKAERELEKRREVRNGEHDEWLIMHATQPNKAYERNAEALAGRRRALLGELLHRAGDWQAHDTESIDAADQLLAEHSLLSDLEDRAKALVDAARHPRASRPSDPTLLPVRRGRKTVVFIHAHPDDESTKGAGAMAFLASCGYDVINITLTDGAAGSVLNPRLDTPHGNRHLISLRDSELRRSSQVLGFRSIQLNYQDSGMAGSPVNAQPGTLINADLGMLTEQVVDFFQQHQVLAVFSYGRTYPHPDHLYVMRLAGQAWTRAQERLGVRAPQFHYRIQMDDAALLDIHADLVGVGGPATSSYDVGNKPVIKLSITPEVDRLRALALRAYGDEHGTQIPADAPIFRGEGTRLGDEYFELASVAAHAVGRPDPLSEAINASRPPTLESVLV